MTAPDLTAPTTRSPRVQLTGRSGSRVFKNGLATVLVWLCFLIALAPLVWILWTVVSRGLHPILSASWWTSDQTGALPPGFDHSVRGGLHGLIGTLLISIFTSVIAIPIGIMTAIYLVEYGRGRIGRLVSFMVDILSGVPSIVAALFVFAVWVTTFGLRLVPACASIALCLLMIPVVTRSTEEMLKLVPHELREASFALGVPKWRTIVSVVLPTAFSGIATGAILGFARVAGETAPLLLLAAYTQYINVNLFSGSMAALPTFINTSYQALSDPTVAARVWGAALTLILLVLLLNLAARLIARATKLKEK